MLKAPVSPRLTIEQYQILTRQVKFIYPTFFILLLLGPRVLVVMDPDKQQVDSAHVESTPVTTGLEDAKLAQSRAMQNREHDIAMKIAIAKYWRSMGYCIFFCMSAVLWGYDMQVNGGLLAAPQFRAVFGYTLPDGETILPARWQAAFNMIATVGGMIGSLLCGPLSFYIGRKSNLALACVIS